VCRLTSSEYSDQGRANRFLIGGVLSKIWAPSISGPPKKKFSAKQKFFPENVGEAGSTIFFPKTKVLKIFRKTNSRIFQHFQPKILQFHLVRAPSPQVGPPYFTFFWGCYTPHTPPGGTALILTLL
jgi:hypothetical protein